MIASAPATSEPRHDSKSERKTLREQMVIQISDSVGGRLSIYKQSFDTGQDMYVAQSLYDSEESGRVVMMEEGAALMLYRALAAALGRISS